MLKKSIILICIFLITNVLFCQEYAEMMQNPNANFYDIQTAFNQFYKNKEYQKGNGWKQFKRWESYMEPRVFPSGKMLTSKRLYKEYVNLKRKYPTNLYDRSSNWQAVGPTTIQNGNGGYSYGLGRVNAIAQSPTNTSILLIGVPQGGIWRSNNAGDTWTPVTDNLPVSGISDIVFDPNNSNIAYACTGDGNGTDSYGIGVLKSNDAGQTWSATGLMWESGLNEVARRIVISHANSNILYVTTTNGLYKSEDAGVHWVLLKSGNFRDIDMHPNDANKIYISNQEVYYSTDGGNTFNLTTGNHNESRRIELAISPVPPYPVYLVAANYLGGFKGFYSSSNGQDFSLETDSPNILNSSYLGDQEGGQAWYDLAITCDPTNSARVLVGGVNVWQTDNGGDNFNILTHWSTGTFGAEYLHGDIHILKFFGNTLFAGNDGGIAKSNNFGFSWTDLSNGLQNTQFYEIDVMPSDATKLIGGSQDNGSLRMDNNNATQIRGGDGMNALFHRSDTNTWFYEWQFGGIHRTTNGGTTFQLIKPQGVGNGNWNTPFETSYSNHNTLYVGYKNLYKSINLGTSYTEIQTPTNVLIDEIALFKGNDSAIAISKKNKLYFTTNGGQNWLLRSGIPDLFIKSIVYHPTNSNKVWVVFSGYEDGHKVYYTSNGGDSWKNVSLNLPNVPINKIIYEPNSDDGLYIGTDMGVFYKNNNLGNWVPFSNGLPVSVIEDLVYHEATNQIFAGTYGRGIYKSNAYQITDQIPTVNFRSDKNVICVGEKIRFEDLSIHHTPNINWSFQNGVPSTSSQSNPKIVWDTPGVYEVKLTVLNGNGNTTKNSYITVREESGLAFPYFEGFEQGILSDKGFVVGGNSLNNFWELNNNIGSTGSNSIYVKNFNVFPGTEFYIESPIINLENQTNVEFSFKSAYVKKNENSSDELRILISKNCGKNWALIKTIDANSLQSSLSFDIESWKPNSTNDWKKHKLNILNNFHTKEFMYKFEFESSVGNNIFIDDINIDKTSGINEDTKKEIKIYPNPVSNLFFIEGIDNDVKIQIFDFQGKNVYSAESIDKKIDVSNLAKGFYTVRIDKNNSIKKYKIIKM